MTRDLRESLRVHGVDIVKDFLVDLSKVEDPAKASELRLRFMDFLYPKPKMEIGLSVEHMNKEQFDVFVRGILIQIEKYEQLPKLAGTEE